MVNKVTLIGHVGKDPEVRRLESGAVVAKFSVATGESYKDKDGNWQNLTEWHDVVVWRELAERVERAVKKGSFVFLEGKITHRKYTDSNNIDRYITEIVSNNLRVLDKKEGGSGGYIANSMPSADNEPPSYRAAAGAGDGAAAAPQTTGELASSNMPEEGDLPF